MVNNSKDVYQEKQERKREKNDVKRKRKASERKTNNNKESVDKVKLQRSVLHFFFLTKCFTVQNVHIIFTNRHLLFAIFSLFQV